MLLLLAHWVEAHPQLAGDAAAMQWLCGNIRASQLPSSYAHHVLYALPWFHISHYHHMDLLAHINAARQATRLLNQAGLYSARPSWFKPARPPSQVAAACSTAAAGSTTAGGADSSSSSSSSIGGCSLSCVYTRADIEAAVKEFCSLPKGAPASYQQRPLGYRMGSDWFAVLGIRRTSGDDTRSGAWLGIHTRAPAGLPPHIGMLVQSKVRVELCGIDAGSGRSVEHPISSGNLEGTWCVPGADSWGYVDAFKVPDAGSLESWKATWDLAAGIKVTAQLMDVD